MLTYVLFMVVVQFSFPQFADGLVNLVQIFGPVTSALGDLNLQVVQ